LSFGDLLVLLLFVVFVILPSITKAQQRRGGVPRAPGRTAAGPGDGAPSGAPTAGGDPAPTRGFGESTAGGRDASAFPPIEDDDLAKRLADARARVQRAMEQRGAAVPVAPPDDPRARAAAPLVSGTARTIGGAPVGSGVDPRARARGPLVSGGARTLSGAPVGSGYDPRGRARAPLFGGERSGAVAADGSPRASTAGGVPAARDLRADAPRLEVERLSGGARGGGAPGGALSLEAGAVRSGLIWHQVLGAPRARRRVGGGPFPER